MYLKLPIFSDLSPFLALLPEAPGNFYWIDWNASCRHILFLKEAKEVDMFAFEDWITHFSDMDTLFFL